MVGRSGKKSIGDVVETFILTIGGKVYTDSNKGLQGFSSPCILEWLLPLNILMLLAFISIIVLVGKVLLISLEKMWVVTVPIMRSQ